MATTRLKEYWSKRDFTRTAEPSGKAAAPTGPRLRFIVQKHAATRLHWDFRLEHDGVMLSWAVTRGPSSDPSQKRLAVQTEDHPLDYGDFEGTIPKGEYGGGSVMLWDRGYWTPEGDMPVEDQLKRGELKFSLDGERMKGSWVLVLLKNDRKAGKTRSGKPRQNWLLIKHRDEHATDDEAGLVETHMTSIASGRAMDDITAGRGKAPTPFMTRADPRTTAVPKPKGRAKAVQAEAEPPPRFIAPQLAKLVDRPPSSAGWLHEIKFDGYRLQLRTEDGRATVRTRSGLDWSDRFPEICTAAAELPDGLIDGEATALDDDDQPDFAALQAALSSKATEGLVFYAFDILHADGQDMRPLPLRDRKAALKAHLNGADPRLIYVEHFETAGSAVLKSACSLDLEGIVSKRADAPYRSGRADAWVKSKCRGGQEVIIAGYATTNGAFRSLIGAVRRDGELVHVGRIGTGYTRATAEMLVKRLKPLATKTSPFGKTGPKAAANVQWVKPELVAEVEFTGWTGDGHLRHAVFKGLREDKPAQSIIREEPASVQAVTGAERGPSAGKRAPTAKVVEATLEPSTAGKGRRVASVPLSNPDKALWPAHDGAEAVTKRELAEYLEAAAPFMLEHMRGRPCSLIRTPDGIEGKQRFFQRHAGAGSSALFTLVDIPDDKQPYLQIDTVEALIAAAQSGATEFHPWNCAPGKPETPGRFVFDLDPDPSVSFQDVVVAAREVKERLEAIGLVPFLKTTGGKGLHIVTPIQAGRIDWKTAKAFTRDLCQWMVDEQPDRYTLQLAKKARGGKIFLDYLRNDRTATAVAVMSPRARPGATVSTPLKWTQATARLNPGAYTIRTALKALKSDPWAGYDEAARPLAAAIKALAKARGG
jgi:bifunctional non-homologous end joining protein LigD